MNVSGIVPWYFTGGQKGNVPQREKNMKESFDGHLSRYLAETSKDPFKECEGCNNNIFDFDDAFLVCGAYYCEECVRKVTAVPAEIEPDEYR